MASTVPGGDAKTVLMHNAATATGNGIALPCYRISEGAMSIASFSVEGISGDTITFEATINGTDWYGILTENITTGTEATTATADGIYRATIAGVVDVRARLTRSAGTVTVTGLVMP